MKSTASRKAMPQLGSSTASAWWQSLLTIVMALCPHDEDNSPWADASAGVEFIDENGTGRATSESRPDKYGDGISGSSHIKAAAANEPNLP